MMGKYIFKSFTVGPRHAPTGANSNPLNPKDDYDVVLKEYDVYFVLKQNAIHERAKFYQRTQQTGKSIECFIRNLHELAQTVVSKNVRMRILEIN